MTKNALYYGDNLSVLRDSIADESVDLVYLDPPFNSNASYNVLFKAPSGQQSQAQIEAFEDTWHWNESAERAFDEVAMRIGKIGWVIAFVALTGVAWQLWPSIPNFITPSFATSTEDRSVFYRLVSRYQYGSEAIDFDIVVGCAVRVTRYGDGEKSYDATRDPVIFAKAASDGSAIAQIVSSACDGETTANGKVPDDFLPGAIWFERKDDFSFGIAYVTEDAFENPKSRLRFLGASIVEATRAEWEAFQPIAAQNLIDPKPFTWEDPSISEEEVRANLWDMEKIKQWRKRINCYLVSKFQFTDPAARAVVAEYWPANRPRFWTLPTEAYSQLADRIKLHNRAKMYGRPMSDLYHYGYYRALGFASRAGGGLLHSYHKPYDPVPPIIYPLRADDGVPWITPSLASASTIYRYVDVAGGANQGLAYCYSSFRLVDSISTTHVPDYRQRQFLTRIDEELIEGEADNTSLGPDRPSYFFENDEFFYLQEIFGLS
jgi:hypothetical protein